MIAPASEPGQCVGGKYRLVRTLGAGGMGIVYEARHELTGKRVAIKRLRPELAARPDHVRRMLREAQASARIRHPHVVDVLDVGTEGDTFFLVMEYLEGETLAARLSRGVLSIAEALAVLVPAMRGVAAGHALGIVHRDIKPENIFLARIGEPAAVLPKVLDFGVSKLLSGDDLSLTESGTTLGTPLYMSYEQLTGSRDVDARTDVYAFAVLLYEALTGRTPYRAETLGSLAVQVATTTPRRPSELMAGLPLELDRIIMHALARSRDERFSSLSAFADALAPFAQLDQRAQARAEERRQALTAELPSARPAEPRSTPDALRTTQAAVPLAPRARRHWPLALAAALLGSGLWLLRDGPATVGGAPGAVKATLAPPAPHAATPLQESAPGPTATEATRAAPAEALPPHPSEALPLHPSEPADTALDAPEQEPARAARPARTERRAQRSKLDPQESAAPAEAAPDSARESSPLKTYRAGKPRLDEF